MPDVEGSLSYINTSLVSFVCLKKQCDKFKLPPSPPDCAFKSVCGGGILVKCHCDRSPCRDAAKPHGLLPFIFIGAAAMA